MSTERLTAENIMEDISSVEEKHTPGNGITQNTFDYGVERINDFVEQKTKQLQGERDRAIGLIMRCNNVYLPEVLQDEIQEFVKQLNQQNEE